MKLCTMACCCQYVVHLNKFLVKITNMTQQKCYIRKITSVICSKTAESNAYYTAA